MRYAKNIDLNQNEIVEQLLDIPGVSVSLDHDDIFVGVGGRNYWFEIKSENAVSKKTGKVLESAKSDSQKELEAEWTGHYAIVSSIEEILEAIND